MEAEGNFAGDFPEWGGAFERGYDNRRSRRRRPRPPPRLRRQQFVDAPVPLDYYYYQHEDVGYYPEPWTMPESGIGDFATQVSAGNGPAPRTGHGRAGGGSRGSSSSSSSSCATDVVSSIPTTARERCILALLNRTGYPMVQDNGQRRYGPPLTWQGEPPRKGCEVFVGKLPRDLFEDELVPFLEQAGRLYEVRLMMDFAGSNRGFAFATYGTRGEAQRAVRDLDEREIRRGRRVGVCESLDNCRLFVGGIPRDKNRDDVLQEMRRVTEGVVDVILYPNVEDKTRNRGFAFVEYADHKAAAVARRRMIPGKMTLWGGYEVAVDWAEPEPIVDDETMNVVTVLYVRNLMLSTSEDVIREAFTLEGQLTVAKIKKIRDFAFVHYLNREDAKLALESMRGAEIEESPIEVAWAKPVNRGKHFDCKPNYGKKNKEFAHGSHSNFRGDPVVMPLPVGGVGYGLYSPASHPVPQPIGSGRPGRAEGLMQNHSGGAPLPNQGTARALRCQQIIQVLNDVCERQGWGVPQFQLVTVASSERSPERNGEPQMPLCFFKVTLPNISPPMYNTITPNKFSRTVEEAQEYAAEYTLHHLLQRLDMATPAQHPHPTSPVFVATQTLPTIGQGYPQYAAVLPGAGFFVNMTARPVYISAYHSTTY